MPDGNKNFAITRRFCPGEFRNTAAPGLQNAYDANGNLTYDVDRNLSLVYNNLNLPTSISSPTGAITNAYRADGAKTNKYVYDASGRTVLSEKYLGNLVLSLGLPLRLLHADGSIELNASLQPTYYYHLKDHLGNVRAVVSPTVSNSLEVVQTTDYYPFGMSLSKNSTTTPYNKYKYNGKLKRSGNPDRSGEEQEMPGKWLDYGARMYDAQLGRWHSMDRFAEKYHTMTPYQYAANNPIKYVDINGDSTYLIVYGSGYLNPNMQGQNNDVGDGFKKNAEARAEELRKNLQEGDDVFVVFAATEDEYVNALNTEYSSGVIKQLDVYSHGTNNSINLGGPKSGAPTETGPGDADYRLVSAFPSQQNPDGNNEIARIDRHNFSTSATVNLWGCNLGGSNSSAITSGANHAQTMANHLGGSVSVNAFNGGGGAEFKQIGDAIIYDGTMIRSTDRGSQRVIQTAYKPR